MSAAGQIIGQSVKTTTIDGVDFVHRVYTVPIAMAVLGSRVFNLLVSARGPEKERVWNAVDEQERERIEEKVFRTMLVSPKVGDIDDGDADTISYQTLKLSKFFVPLQRALYPQKEAGDEEDFTGASPEPTA